MKKFVPIVIIILLVLIVVLLTVIAIKLYSNNSEKITSVNNSNKTDSGITGKVIDNPKSSLVVTNVVDGDTVDLSNGERVRLIGINTVEKGQNCFEEAKDRLEELVLNKEIKLEKDIDDRDQYGRILRFIFIGNQNINVLLVKEGLANVFIYGANKKYLSELEAAERIAREGDGCIWQKSYSCKNCIGISYFHWNAKDDDCNNSNDEYVKFANSCEQECDMTGWTVKDKATHIYTFPSFILMENSQVTLRSGSGQDTSAELFWINHGNAGSCPAIWNNDHDTLYLRDSAGKLVVEYGY